MTKAKTSTMWGCGALVAAALIVAVPSRAQDVYQAPGAFLSETFPESVPQPELLSITPEMRKEIERILRHSYSPTRVRYWREGGRSAWILEEIGKYKPITVGLVVANGKIETLRVLIYRETHGWEVRHAFFTDQFRGLSLDDKKRLNAHVDGISGATLSVNALQNLARLALYLDNAVQVP
jgi:hypothetical protein